jgi:integrase/recombinase XerC
MQNDVNIKDFKECNIAPDLNELCLKWLVWLKNEKNYSNYTVISYHKDLSSILKFLANYINNQPTIETIKNLSINDIRAWLAYLKNEHYNTTSIARHLASLRNFFTYLNKYENFNNKAPANIKIRKINKPLPKTIDETSTKTAIEEALSLGITNWVNLRDYAIMMLLYGCGLRISEALSISKSNINNGFITVTGKGNKSRSIPILPQVVTAINQYINNCPYVINNSQAIFIGKHGKVLNPRTVQKTLTTIRRKLNLPEFLTPHSFRHNFATHLLANGADLRSIQELLGHKNLSTTQIYTKVDQKRIFDIYTKAHPRSN